jgi:hypothetical protein
MSILGSPFLSPLSLSMFPSPCPSTPQPRLHTHSTHAPPTDSSRAKRRVSSPETRPTSSHQRSTVAHLPRNLALVSGYLETGKHASCVLSCRYIQERQREKTTSDTSGRLATLLWRLVPIRRGEQPSHSAAIRARLSLVTSYSKRTRRRYAASCCKPKRVQWLASWLRRAVWAASVASGALGWLGVAWAGGTYLSGWAPLLLFLAASI